MTTYQLDYVGPGHPTLGGVGQFGSYVTEVVQRDDHGEILTATDGTPLTKPVTLKYGPHGVSSDMAAQFDTPEMQALGWVVSGPGFQPGTAAIPARMAGLPEAGLPEGEETPRPPRGRGNRAPTPTADDEMPPLRSE